MNALHHTAITVSNLDRSIDFYCGVLGLALAHEPTEFYSGAGIERALNLPGAKLRIAVVSAGVDRIELLEYAEPPAPAERAAPGNTRGAAHLAFLVEDIEARKAELEAKGITFFSEVNTNAEGPLAGWRWVYFSDPDGIPLELIEIAFRRDDERRAGVAAYFAARGQ